MTSERVALGPFSSIYVGDADESDVLTRITSQRTEGTVLNYNLPEKYVKAVGNSVQVGEAEINFGVNFIGDADQIMKLAMGNPLSANRDDPPSFALYTLLLLSDDAERANSFLIPRCYSLKRWSRDNNKSKITTLKIDFTFKERNRYVKLFHKGTYVELQTVLGARSPSELITE